MAGFFSFLRSYGSTQVQKAGQSFVGALASWDPEGASEAEIEEVSKNLDKIVLEVEKAREIWRKEQAEADAVNKTYTKRLKAAEILQGKLETASEDEKPGIESALNTLLSQLEESAPEIEREEQEAADAKEFVAELEVVAKTTADKLKTARKKLNTAIREMQRAKIREQRNKDAAKRAEIAAGISKQSDSFGVALQAMQKKAEKSNTKAEAAKLKAQLLDTSSGDADNAVLAAALKEASGAAVPSASVSDRLAALKRR